MLHYVIPVDKVKELTQDQDGKPLTHETLCNAESCSTDPGPAESGGLPAFFSLAALAEVAAMENMHRYVMTPSTHTQILMQYFIEVLGTYTAKQRFKNVIDINSLTPKPNKCSF